MANPIPPPKISSSSDLLWVDPKGVTGLEQVIADLQAKLAAAEQDRESIVSFLTAEAKRFDVAASESATWAQAASPRLRAQASIGRTWAAQIARGDDRNGSEQ